MPSVQTVTLQSPHYGAIELTSHDFDSPLTQLIATLWTEGRCPLFAAALRQHVASQRADGVGLCHLVAQELVLDAPDLRHYWSERRDASDHSWVEFGDETLDTVWTLADDAVLSVMPRDLFHREHRVVRPRRWTHECSWDRSSQ